jgi:prevent-host-death family protein
MYTYIDRRRDTNMTKTVPITEARYELAHLLQQFEQQQDPEAVAVTRRGKPVLAVMPWELYECLVETLEVMSDPELMKVLRKSIHEIKSGRVYSNKQVKRELGL